MSTTSTAFQGPAIGQRTPIADDVTAARLATAAGVVGLASVSCFAVFSVVGGPFGTLNDIGNGTLAVVSGALAWALRRHVPVAATGAALGGAALAVVGSALVISGTTGFFLAGLVSSVGFAGIGGWLIALVRSGATGDGTRRKLGLLAGASMAVGILSLPGIPMRLDDMATAPGWIWIGFVGWFGTFLVYPFWAIAVGRTRS